MRGLAEEAGAASEEVDAALQRAGESALRCLKEKKEKKEKKEEPATEGDDDAQPVALAQEVVVEDVVEAGLSMSEGEKEDLVARVKEEGKEDEVMDALRKAMKEATPEQKAALRELLEGLKPAGDKPERK